MNQNFKFKYDEMRQGNPADNFEDNIDYQSYEIAGHARSICFKWPDGKLKFLNYAYLIWGEYIPEESIIILSFTSERVTISGNNLDALFIELISHSAKTISCSEDRYSNLENPNALMVKEIKITPPI